MTARDLMTSNPDTVTPEDVISRAAQIMRERGVGSVPVVKDRESMKLEGIITDRDIVVRHVAEDHDLKCSVSTHMTKKLETVREDHDLEQVEEVMKRGVRRVLVVDGDGCLVGIIAQADLATSGRVPRGDVAEVVQTISSSASSRA